MRRRIRVELRRRWTPAPGWPSAPIGFTPSDAWSPHPSWPPAPEGWTDWRAHRGRLIAAAILGGVAAFCVFGILKSVSEADRQSVLAKQGVRTLASVVHSSYDSEGGDPGGWTTDQVTFTDRSGQTIAATVGHHYDDAPERANGHLAVIYDPAHPATAISVVDHQDDQSAGGVVIGIGLLAVSASAAVGFLTSALRFTFLSASSFPRTRAAR